jgi:hypothetical protein
MGCEIRKSLAKSCPVERVVPVFVQEVLKIGVGAVLLHPELVP